VEKGEQVARGDVIARSGNSGRSSAPHLHYEIRVGGRPVNPLTYILDSYAARQ
jgi:murein DD-endopeptidase MepM/ murein hydrolase activator NlpD